MEDIEEYGKDKNILNFAPEKRLIIKEVYERQQFFKNIEEGMVVCDPLDRCNDSEKYPALNKDEFEEIVTVAELRDKMFSMPYFEGGDQLQVSLPQVMYDILQNWIERDWSEISQLAENFFLKTAKKYGELSTDTFSNLPKVKHLMETLDFFDREKLYDSMQKEIASYKEFIQNIEENANSIKKDGSSLEEQNCI